MFDFLSPFLGPTVVPQVQQAGQQFMGGLTNDPSVYGKNGPQIAQHADHPANMWARMGQTIGDFGRGLSQEGLGGLLDTSGMMDRQAAQRELKSKFDIVPDGFVGPRMPNQLTEKEFEQQAHVFSDIRMGRSDIKFGDKTDQKYRDGAMNDMARMMQTSSGRQLLDTLANNTAGEKDAKGNPVHHTTTLQPFLKKDGTPDTSNSDELGLDVKNHADENGTGVNTRVRYNPGLDVGNGKQPWWPGRSDVILMHEMTHAYYDTQGTTDNGMVDPKTGDGVKGNIGAYKNTLHRYEHQAAGMGHYENAPISENKYRDERRLMGDAKAPGSIPGDAGMAHRDYY